MLEVDGEFDVVVANILAPSLVAMAPSLRRLTAAGGRLIVSGVLAIIVIGAFMLLAIAICNLIFCILGAAKATEAGVKLSTMILLGAGGRPPSSCPIRFRCRTVDCRSRTASSILRRARFASRVERSSLEATRPSMATTKFA